MAFLDNSGDIILDAVLTDTGRFRLARGDGSFKITKFAFGDEEIDYSLYNKNHISGSAYFDLQILQTPILEAFTNNTSTMKSKLMTISRTNLLYLPILKINDKLTKSGMFDTSGDNFNDLFLIAVDGNTLDDTNLRNANGNSLKSGILNGTSNVSSYGVGGYIRVDQGLDSNEISPSLSIDQDLYETQYMLEIDDRLGRICTKPTESGNNQPGSTISFSFLDDDMIASYYVTDSQPDFVKNNQSTGHIDEGAGSTDNTDQSQVIRGPRGSMLEFSIRASTELQTSSYLFDRFGSTDTANIMGLGNTIKYIDTNVRVTGVTTGYRLDLPIRFVKKPS